MTANEIISKVDALQPNQYSFEDKLGWISQIDGELFKDVILTHSNQPLHISERTEFGNDNTLVYLPYETGDEELIVGKPYGEALYVAYLQSMIARENSEIVKYQQHSQTYNAAYLSWAGYYNRTHLPKQPRGGSRFRF